jgi:hypothetical protein
LATTRRRASTAQQCRHCLSASEFVLNHEADAAGRAVLSQQDSPDEPIPPDVIGSESASRAAKRGWRGRLDSHRLGCATSARGRCIPTVSSVSAPVLRTSPLTAHPWTEVRAANRRSNDLEDSPMSRIFASSSASGGRPPQPAPGDQPRHGGLAPQARLSFRGRPSSTGALLPRVVSRPEASPSPRTREGDRRVPPS